MRTQKQILTALIFFTSIQISAGNSEVFENAVNKARKAHLLGTSQAENGLPFYRPPTWDPTWNPNEPIIEINSFPFVNHEGVSVSADLFKGKPSIVAFFFTSCAGFCPMLIKNLQDVEKTIQKKYPDTQYFAITVDPETDTPQRLKDYFKKMKLTKNWQLLTGDRDKIFHFAKDTLAAEVFALPISKGQVSHTEHFYVFDKDKRLRSILNGDKIQVANQASKVFSDLYPHGVK